MKVYAGFDCSTQGMAVVAIDATTRTVVFRDALEFDTPFIAVSDPGVVHASPRMWSAALETMLGRLASHIDPATLAAISGSAQQHGSVYCGERPGDLTRETSPIWMDGSTLRECEEIEAALGGAAAVARLTGSRAYPRFTGPQIRKFARDSPGAYGATRRIHLVSSYLASWFAGDHAPIDHADGSGMNLMDLRNRTWSRAALDATAPGLAGKLPPLVPSGQVIGALHERWQRRFDLPAVPIVAWSGDNPCSLVGSGVVHEGQIAISLGTSDTIFGPMGQPRVSSDGTGHVFASPTGGYMGITVFRNGSLARERVRDEFEMDWPAFSDALRATPAGNDGAMMLPWFEPEITPLVEHPSPVRVGLDDAAPERHVRAIVEAQMIALARHSEWMGITPRAIHATGGASANPEILQVIADVFDAEVDRFDSTDAAALGAALRAWQAHAGLEWAEVVSDFVKPLSEVIKPIEHKVRVYKMLKRRYGELEAGVLRR